MDALYLFLFTDLASTEGFLVISALILALLLRAHERRRALIYLGAMLGLLLSTAALKAWLAVERPGSALIETTGYAFPSGHATGVMFLALSVAYLARDLPKPLRYGVYAACFLFAGAVGLSRLHFGVHTPLQVGAGYVLGALWSGIFICWSRRY